MKEIELKILGINPAEITKKLAKLGATKNKTVLISETIFDLSKNITSKKGDLFRIRKVGNIIEITYKYFLGPKNTKFLMAEEIETEVKDFKKIKKIINLLGFKCLKNRQKKRTSFKLGKVKIEIDKFPEIPAYLEIEGSKKEILTTIKLLGLENNKTTNKTATQVLKLYKANYKIQKFKKQNNNN